MSAIWARYIKFHAAVLAEGAGLRPFFSVFPRFDQKVLAARRAYMGIVSLLSRILTYLCCPLYCRFLQCGLFALHIGVYVLYRVITERHCQQYAHSVPHISSETGKVRHKPYEENVQRIQGETEEQGFVFVVAETYEEPNPQSQYRSGQKKPQPEYFQLVYVVGRFEKFCCLFLKCPQSVFGIVPLFGYGSEPGACLTDCGLFRF